MTAVVATAGTGIPTGTVTFLIDGKAQAPVRLTEVGRFDQAGFTTATLMPGTHAITAAYSGDTTFASSGSNPVSVTISPAPTSKLVIHTQPSPSATAGQAFAVQPVIYIEDANGNLETGDNSTVVSVALASGNGLPEGTTSVTVKDGVATFACLKETTAGTIAIEFSGDGLTAGPSNNIVVSPAAPFRLKIQTQPSSTAMAGQAFATQPVIYEMDLYGNLETTDNSTVITASLSFGNGTLLGKATASLVGGVATFTDLAGSSVGTMALGFSGGGLSVGPSNNVVINPTPAPTTSGEPVVKMKLTNKKGKPTGKTALEFSLKYSTAMNPALARLRSNYHVEAAFIKGTKKKSITYKPVPFTAFYNQSTNTVTLTTTGNQPFTSGGRIIINAAPPNGVSSADGVLLNASDVDYTISSNGKRITPG